MPLDKSPAPFREAPELTQYAVPPEDVRIAPPEGSPPDPAPAGPVGSKPSPNIELCPDGVYRWFYEYHMLKNPVVLLTVLKVLGIGALAVFLLGLVTALFEGGSLPEMLWKAAMPALIGLGIIGVLAIPSYLIVAKSYGWKYIVLFEMDEEGVTHMPEPKQFTTAKALGWLTFMAGQYARNPGAAGAGLMAASHDGTRSTFQKVRCVKVLRRWNTIKVNQPFAKNQVYAKKEDFDFVRSYILARVPDRAKGRREKK